MLLLPTFRLAGKSEEGTPGTFSARRSGSAEAPGKDDPWGRSRLRGQETGHAALLVVVKSLVSALTPTCLDIWALLGSARL